MRIPLRAKVGIAIAAIGILVPVTSGIWYSTRHFVPLDTPISLVPGHLRKSFKLNFSDLYHIDIQVERKLPDSTIECLLGVGDHVRRGQCDDIPSVVQFLWRLRRDDETVQTGSSTRAIAGMYNAKIMNRNLTYFHGIRGEQFTLDIDLLQDGSKLSATNPRLRAEVTPQTYVDLIYSSFLSIAFAILCCIVGGSMIVISLIREGRRQRVTTQTAPSSI